MSQNSKKISKNTKKGRNNTKKGSNEIKRKAQELRKKNRQEKQKAKKETDDAIQKKIDNSWWERKREQQIIGLSPVEESPEKTPDELNEMLKNLNSSNQIRYKEDYKKDYKTLRKLKNPSSNKGKLNSRIKSIKPTLLDSMRHRLNPHSTSIGTIRDDGTFNFVEMPSTTSRGTKKKRYRKKKKIKTTYLK